MPNPLNFGSSLGVMNAVRPYRISPDDQQLVVTGEKTVIFGSHPNDNVEMWFCDPDGKSVGSIVLNATSPHITLSTVIDTTGTFEVLNLNLETILPAVPLAPGRYGVSVYLFRNEVGSMTDKRLYISEISPSRTELKLNTDDFTDLESQNEIYEFIVPSVPRLYAKGLVDQFFAKNIDQLAGESVNIVNVSSNVDEIIANTMVRVFNAEAVQSYNGLFKYVTEETYLRAVSKLEIDTANYNVQSRDIDNYISTALDEVISELVDTQRVDPRFNLV